MRPIIIRRMQDAIEQIRAEGLHGSRLSSPPGTKRGLDMLGDDFDDAILRSSTWYRWRHGRSPNLIDPSTFTEKQTLFKFFGPIPEATPSDKLRSPAYLPVALRDRISLPKRFFVTDKPELPEDDFLPPGTYYFKSNHSSGTNMRIRFPLTEKGRAEALWRAKKWMTRTHSRQFGLWWYEIMPRNVYIEEDLGSEIADAPDWKFFVCNGRVEIYQVDVDRSRDHVQTIYERDGTFVPQELYFKSGTPVDPPPQLGDMIDVAEAIGANFDFIRVDLFLKDDRIYLGEIGLVPNGGAKAVRSPELDERLGAAWKTPWLGNVVDGYPGSHYANIKTFGWDW